MTKFPVKNTWNEGSFKVVVVALYYYLVCMSNLDDYITDINKLGYTDDHGLYTSFNANNRDEDHHSIAILENSLDKVKEWMALNKLKMNDTKTEVILFGNLVQLKRCETTCIRVGTSNIEFQQCIKCLGVILDKNHNLKKHITNKCKTASFNLHEICKVGKISSIENLKKLVLSLVISHLDYANSLLYSLPKPSIKPMQCIQNLAAKLILQRDNYSSSMDALKEMHWLPVKYRIMFKCYCVCFKVVNKQAHKYLDNMFITRNVSGNLGSKRDAIAVVMKKRSRCKLYGDRTSEIYGPKLWNKLKLPVYMKKETKFPNLRKF